ncbi:hypothetical protein H6G89_27920 [Oscillatoria sp. FACHB-1407]|uniref:hypothetical protein n=1 Tax=Oscillatoria sp. FACHB-1407 TaxID=2692847 RepID=UPI0016854EC3|nr:hypothetical protein [Oscillatoria sp. FACHB-1407]MBD2464834.1 hypothetical protein [Oscillatoria sp. FACHB-1407]
MRETAVAPEQRHSESTFRKLVRSLIIGLVLGTIAGIPIGWFTHRVFAQQRAAQVLLCRQQHYGQAEATLQDLCGTVY